MILTPVVHPTTRDGAHTNAYIVCEQNCHDAGNFYAPTENDEPMDEALQDNDGMDMVQENEVTGHEAQGESSEMTVSAAENARRTKLIWHQDRRTKHTFSQLSVEETHYLDM